MKIGKSALLLLALAQGLLVPWAAVAQTQHSVGETIELARSHLFSAQNPDGSIGDFATSGWAAMALVAAGTSPTDTRFAALSSYLIGSAQLTDAGSATELERTILALTAISANPYGIGDRNLVNDLKGLASVGQIGSATLLNDDIFAILALRAAGQEASSEPLASVIEFVKRNQLGDGGFNDRVGIEVADIDMTAAAIVALQPYTNTASAKQFLRGAQNQDGGFGSRVGSGSNVASTAWVVWAIGANQAILDYLINQQQENGSFGSILVTAYALQALSGRGLPIGFVTAPPEAVQTSQPAETKTTQTQPTGITPRPTPIPPSSVSPALMAKPQTTITRRTGRAAARTQKTTKQPTAQAGDQPISNPSQGLRPASQPASLLLVSGSFPQETLAQASFEAETVTVPQHKQQPSLPSSLVAVIAVIGVATFINTLGLVVLWRRLATINTGSIQQPSTPS